MLEALAALALPPTQYQRAVAEVRGYLAQETQLPLQKGAETRFWAHPDVPPRGTLVMYHGFTAGTWQFDLLAKQAHAAGYNVFVPRLPGHGLKTTAGVEDPSGLLTGPRWRDYVGFGDRTIALARRLGGPVGTLGLSVGGNVAVAMAERHPEVTRTVAYAPFLWPLDGRVQHLFNLAHAVDTLGRPGQGVGDLFNGYRLSWGEECRLDTLSGKRPGHSWFKGGAAYAATELGREVIAEAPKATAALQVFATAIDDAAEEGAIRKLHAAWGGRVKGFYYYPRAEAIPHPMLHPQEDQGRGHTPALYAMTLRFLATGQPLDRPALKPSGAARPPR